jgi:GNAT superfamily N-acetyltransferase
MIVREAIEVDRPKIIDLYKQSQDATGLPNPSLLPPDRLEQYLYERAAVKRLVALNDNDIVGHCLVETANPRHELKWRSALQESTLSLLEIGGAFVKPQVMYSGIGTMLLEHALKLVKEIPAQPVSATWSSNMHVKRMFLRHAAKYVGDDETTMGVVSLFVF